ncbi:uncharacterized protein LOC124286257 [Haliotis rubra]|uniref:uncharacterized protein LOC124286257 n=1 Tax=Haliotis rubra TaxID=36100 RepID=UPI001EE58C84|nr:uncharacterized protein LOC124286257 [Haliotis rubra]
MTSSTPLAWSSSRQYYHYRSVFPTSDTGMQATLHRNVPRRMHSRRTVENPAINILSGRRIIERQRLPTRLPKCYLPYLSQLDTDADDASGSMSNRDLPTLRSLPVLPERRFTSADVKRITTRLSTYDVSRVPESRGFPAKDPETPRSVRRGYTDSEIHQVVQRLSDYNPKKHPAESKGTPAESDLAPKNETSSGKQYSTGDVEAIVNRLHSFDPVKWPPESKASSSD